jgi:aminoglycoside phosphotransferase (APT) family kinase protein
MSRTVVTLRWSVRMIAEEIGAESIDRWRERFPCERVIDAVLTRKVLQRRSGPYRPIQAIELEPKLAEFLACTLGMRPRTLQLRRLPGGASKEQFVADVTYGADSDQVTSDRLVLRFDPAESVVETSRLREAQLMRALAAVVPIPDVLCVDAEGQYLGRPCIITRFVNGVTKPTRRRSGNVTGIGIHFDPEWRERLKRPFVENLARIHAFDWRSAALDAFDPPPVGSTLGVERILNWHDRVWREDCLEPEPLMELAAAWLRDHMPTIDRATVVHGDYRSGNFLFDEDSGRITAVLDWEMGLLGDYHHDLSYTMQPNAGSYDETGEFLVAGLVSRSEFLDLYQELSGLSVDPMRLEYYEILNARHCAISSHGTAPRVAKGAKTHQDVLCVYLSSIGPSFMEDLRMRLARKI